MKSPRLRARLKGGLIPACGPAGSFTIGGMPQARPHLRNHKSAVQDRGPVAGFQDRDVRSRSIGAHGHRRWAQSLDRNHQRRCFGSIRIETQNHVGLRSSPGALPGEDDVRRLVLSRQGGAAPTRSRGSPRSRCPRSGSPPRPRAHCANTDRIEPDRNRGDLHG